MQEIRCPKCGEVFQVDETGYDQIAQQVRDKEFDRELERRKKELEAKHERELEVIRLQEEKEHTASMTQKDAEISAKERKIAELQALCPFRFRRKGTHPRCRYSAKNCRPSWNFLRTGWS